MSGQPPLVPGQVWRLVKTPRIEVEVIQVWAKIVVVRRIDWDRLMYRRPDEFKGKLGGYEYVREATPSAAKEDNGKR